MRNASSYMRGALRFAGEWLRKRRELVYWPGMPGRRLLGLVPSTRTCPICGEDSLTKIRVTVYGVLESFLRHRRWVHCQSCGWTMVSVGSLPARTFNRLAPLCAMMAFFFLVTPAINHDLPAQTGRMVAYLKNQEIRRPLSRLVLTPEIMNQPAVLAQSSLSFPAQALAHTPPPGTIAVVKPKHRPYSSEIRRAITPPGTLPEDFVLSSSL